MLRSQGVPFVDPAVDHVGVSKLRTLNASNLSKISKMMVIQDNDTPLAVLLNFEQYMTIQNKLQEALDRIELLSKREDEGGLRSGVRDVVEGRIKPLSEVDPDLKLK